MSGDEYRRPAEPLDFTDAEVKELAGRRTKPVAAVSRLKKAVPTVAIGRLASDRPTPMPISRDELAVMRRASGRPDKIVGRFTPSEVPAEEQTERSDRRVEAPAKKPPTTKE